MSLEIERKFLVQGADYLEQSVRRVEFKQFYLCNRPGCVVRVRVISADGEAPAARITVKGANRGMTRNEWEYPLPASEALEMLPLAIGRVISKTRYFVPAEEGLCWEVDRFHGALEGLVMAEIELPDEATEVKLPGFIGREVTGDARYYNSALSLDKGILPPFQ